MALLIRNGEIITADSRSRADIFCEGETITRIGAGLDAPPGTEVVDATDKYVFPGFIDPHVHITLPFMGTSAKDTYEPASRAALVGGTTTLIEMCCPARTEDTLGGFEHWLAQAAGRSACRSLRSTAASPSRPSGTKDCCAATWAGPSGSRPAPPAAARR